MLSDMEFTVQVIGSKNFPQPIAHEAKMLCMCQLNNFVMNGNANWHSMSSFELLVCYFQILNLDDHYGS